MKFTTLEKNPEYFFDTIALIEKAFNYSKNNSFLTDFYPLMNKANHKNCFLLILENQVIAHIGALEKSLLINNTTYEFIMYGGIAVADQYQGKGYFRNLFEYVLEEYKEKVFHLLWSEKIDVYEKFSFHPAIGQYQFNHDLSDATEFLPFKLSDLTKEEINQMHKLYINSTETRCLRRNEDWNLLCNITSADLFIKKTNNEISNYIFINKGQDLQGVIHEVGHFNDHAELVKYGILWSPHYNETVSEIQYAANMKIGSYQIFSQFILDYTNQIIKINKIEQEYVDFEFENKKFKLEHPDFLSGIFGPGQFRELSNCKPIYISGLDSI
jgi:GNAT superfamily N-acetyltransferase